MFEEAPQSKRIKWPLALHAFHATFVVLCQVSLPLLVWVWLGDVPNRPPIVGAVGFGVLLASLYLRTMLPFWRTAQALRQYLERRKMPDLPTDAPGIGGQVLADVQQVLNRLNVAAQHLEQIDPVTGAMTSVGLGQALQYQKDMPQVIVTLRISNSEDIAQTHGQGPVEHALSVLADRLRLLYGRDLTLARMQSDVLVFNTRVEGLSDQQVDELAFRLRNQMIRLAEPVPYFKSNTPLHLSAGIAPLTSNIPQSINRAIDALDLTAPNWPVAIHSAQAQHRLKQSFSLEKDLARALDRDEFLLHYQPVVDTEAGAAVGAEALLRWQSPERGIVPPAQFIPLAEASGLINPIGRWVMRKACEDIANWPSNRSVAINLGAPQFMDPNLVSEVEDAISRSGIMPRQLSIELTETVAMVDHAYAYRTFSALREMGVRLLLDDFGTGYASLSTLHQLPFSTIKVDRQFVSEVHLRPTSRAICASLLAMGKGLSVNVLAEGTETADEVTALRQMGCRLFQGYHFSRPLPLDEVEEMFENLPQTKLSTRLAS